MRFDAILITAVLFYALVPGVLITLPPRGSRNTVLLVHALVFAVVAHLVLRFYHRYIIFREGFGNFGPTCPNGYMMDDKQVCRPTGRQTQQVNTGFRPTI